MNNSVECISTDGVAPSRRSAFWTEAACRVFTHLDTRPAYPDEFNASLRRVRLGDFALTQVVSAPCFVEHPSARARQTCEPVFFIHLQANGASLNRQDGREALLRTGDFTLCDNARPYDVRFESTNDMLVLRIPAAELHSRLVQPEAFTARRIAGHTGIGGLASQTLRHAWQLCLEGVDPALERRLMTNVVDLLVTAFCAERPEVSTEGAGARSNAHRLRMLHYIEKHLADPELGPKQVAAAIGITPRYAHQLFRGRDESVAAYIQRRRLEESAHRLRDPTQLARTVTDIAFQCGFSDSTVFGRCFKKRFGTTPRDFRQQQAPAHKQ
jgi:AraC family transcriptional regulator, positive regulator of tynA and feaB